MKFFLSFCLLVLSTFCYGQNEELAIYYPINQKYKNLKIRSITHSYPADPFFKYTEEYDTLGRVIAEYEGDHHRKSYVYSESNDTLVKEIYTEQWHDVYDPIGIEKYVFDKFGNIIFYTKSELLIWGTDTTKTQLTDKFEYSNQRIYTIRRYLNHVNNRPFNNLNSVLDSTKLEFSGIDSFIYYNENKAIIHSSFNGNGILGLKDTSNYTTENKLTEKKGFVIIRLPGTEGVRDQYYVENRKYSPNFITTEIISKYPKTKDKAYKFTHDIYKTYFDINGLDLKTVIIDKTMKEKIIDSITYLYYK